MKIHVLTGTCAALKMSNVFGTSAALDPMDDS